MGQPKSGSSTVAPSSSGVAALNQVLPQVQQYLSPTTNPYVPVTQQIAQQNPEQLAAAGQYSTAFGAANTGLGTYGQASDLIQGAAQPLTQAEIDQYFNPYVNQVVGATEQQFNLQNAQQQNQVVGNEATQGALGGNRTAVAGALTAGQQTAAEDPIIAGMLQAGYTQAEATAYQQFQQTPLAAASALQQVGAGQEAAAGAIGNLALGQYGLGSLQQNYYTPGAPTTATLNALYAEQMAKYGYPIQLTNMAAGDVSGLSGAYGSNTTTTPPPPSLVNTLGGLGTFGVGAGVLLSDRRLKEDIKVIGKTKDGQTIYRFRFKGHPQWHIGLMAQDVEKKHPEAVGRIGGYKAIDVKKATDAAARFAGGRVQGLQTGGVPAMPYGASPISGLGPMPYAGGSSYIPQVGVTNFARPPTATMAQPQDDSSSMFMNALKLSEIGSKSGTDTSSTPGSYPAQSPDIFGPAGGFGDTAQDTMQDLTAGSNAFPVGTPGATGGRVPRAYGGLALPSSNRINVPTRGGLGMPSSMVMRRDAGGSADMSDTSTSAGTDVPPLNPMMANITYGLYGEAAPYGAQGMAEGGAPKDDIAPDDTVLMPDDTPPPETPVQVAQGPAPAGVASDAPEIVSTGVSRRAPEDPRGMVPYIRETAKKYGIDPNVAVNVARSEGLGTFTSGIPGEKSFGAFQLNTQGGMGNEFYRDTGLDPSDPRNEKATIDYALSKASTGGWGPFHGAKNRYGYSNFAGINGNDGTQALALTEDTSGRSLGTASPAGGIPGVTPIKAPDLSGKTKPDKTDIALSIMAAGLGMMGSRSPYAGVGIGQGGLQGIQTYEALHKQRVGEAEHQATLEQQAAIANQRPEIQQQLFAQQKQLEGLREDQAKRLLEQKEAFDLRKPQLVTLPNGRQMMVQSYPDASQPGGFGFRTIDPRKLPGSKTPAAETSLPAGTDPKTGIDPKTGRDERYLAEEVDPEDQKLVKALVDLRKDPATMSFKQRTELQRQAANYDSNWHEENYKNLVKTEQEFNSTSPSRGGGQIRAFNNSVQHLNTLDGIIDAMNNGDFKAFTRLRNAYNEQVGKNIVPAEMEAARDIVGKEVVKSIIPGGGGEREREEVASRLAADRSPATLKAVTKTYRELAGAQLRDLRVQFETGTYGRREGDFEKKLIPESQRELERAYARTVARPSGLPAGSSYNYKKGQFKTPDGRILDADGNEVGNGGK